MPATEATLKIVKVGQGDCILITTPSGKLILVDAGSKAGVRTTNRAVPPGEDWNIDDVRQQLWGPALVPPGPIEILVMTHHDQDHYNLIGLVIGATQVNNVYYSGQFPKYACAAFTRWTRQNKALFTTQPKSISVNDDNEGPWPIFHEDTDGGEEFVLDILASNYQPASKPGWTISNCNSVAINTRSIVLKGSLNQNSFMLTGDATSYTEQFLCDQYTYEDTTDLAVDVIKVAHHGSGHSSTQPFVDLTSPREAVISVRPRSSGYKHPRSEIAIRWFNKVEKMATPHLFGCWYPPGHDFAGYREGTVVAAIFETGLNGMVTYTFPETGTFYRTDDPNNDPNENGGDNDPDFDPEEEDDDGDSNMSDDD